MQEQHAVVERMMDKKCGQKNLALPEKIELAIGMKVMVIANMETNIDIANGSRGKIVGIVFEEGEAPTSEEVIQEIHRSPLVKLARTRLSALQGLSSGTEDNKFSDRNQSNVCFQTIGRKDKRFLS
jgi:hypothetical protein